MNFKIKKFIKINPFIIPILCLSILSDYFKEFLTVLFLVTIHEIIHILVAYKFGCKLEKLYITPLGQKAILKNFNKIMPIKKFIVVLSGPLFNLILFLICDSIFYDSFEFFKKANLVIFLFNMFPIYPLDGGRLLQILLEDIVGFIIINKFILNLTKIISLILILFGLIQNILYPFNISLILISMYIRFISISEYTNNTIIFYKDLVTQEKKYCKYNILKIKNIIVGKDYIIKDIIEKTSWGTYLNVSFFYYNKLITFSENEIINYFLNENAYSKLEDIYLKKY